MSSRFGLLYDAAFAADLADHHEALDLLEVIPDRLFGGADDPLFHMSRRPPVVFHSLNLSLGSDQELDEGYVADLCAVADRLKPLWASDHLAISQMAGAELGHLSPIRWTAAAVDLVGGKIAALQERLQVPFLVENIAYYFRIPGAELEEAELLARVARTASCGLLLDLNNVVVNAANHGFDPYDYLHHFPLDLVREIHVAGHRKAGRVYLDSHDTPVSDRVWNLLAFVAGQVADLNVILERDDRVPPVAELVAELATARRRVGEAQPARPSAAGVSA